MAAPLTKLLKKENFVWTAASSSAFDMLKHTISSDPVLQLPNFNHDFIVECDASGSGICAVLHQSEGPIASFSQPMALRHKNLAAYEQELIGLVQAIRHWRLYLWGRAFLVQTDHYSLKFLLDQRLATIPQHHWVSKLLGFDFRVEYHPGRQNTVANALSRRDSKEMSSLALFGPQFAIFDDIRREIKESAELQAIKSQVLEGTADATWGFVDDLLTYKAVYICWDLHQHFWLY